MQDTPYLNDSLPTIAPWADSVLPEAQIKAETPCFFQTAVSGSSGKVGQVARGVKNPIHSRRGKAWD